MNKFFITLLSVFLGILFTGTSAYAGCHVSGSYDCHGNGHNDCVNWSCDDGDTGTYCSNRAPGTSPSPDGAVGPGTPTDPPPPPPPPTPGRCNPAFNGSGSPLFAAPSSNLCALGSHSAIQGTGSQSNPWTWHCTYEVAGPQCSAYSVPSSAATCGVNPACPDTRNVNETVTWTASVTGFNVANFTFAWTGDGFVNGKTTAVVSGTYSSSTPRIKHASVSIHDALGNPVPVNCPSVCGRGGGGGGGGGGGDGIEITSHGVCNPNYTSEGDLLTHPNPANLCANGTVANFVTIPPVDNNYWTDKMRWTWTCKGTDPHATPTPDRDAECAAALNPLDTKSKALDCEIKAPNSLINLNANSVWTASSTPRSGNVIWRVVDINGTSTLRETSNPLNHAFRTIGIKTVSTKIASSTIVGVYGKECTATTTVVQQGGSSEEI